MPYIVKKSRESMVLVAVDSAIADTYQSINLKPYYVEKFFSRSESISKSKSPTTYSDLEALIKEVNLFKPRVEVPNKSFKADKPGKSCLRRDPVTGRIYLSYRGKGVTGGRSPNVCFLTDDSNSAYSSWVCMRTFNKTVSSYSGSPVYYINKSHPDYSKWSSYMDSEYERLTGTEIVREEIRPIVNHTSEELELIESCEMGYCNTPDSSLKEIFASLADRGLCKLNNLNTSIYDKDGYWIGRFEEYTGKYSGGEAITKVLSRLTLDELKVAKTCIDRYVDDNIALGGLFSL